MEKKKYQKKPEPVGPYSPWRPGMKKPEFPGNYVIEVLGCLNSDWSEWFGGLKIECNEMRGITYIFGSVKDQAELYSILLKIRNLGLTLIRLNSNNSL